MRFRPGFELVLLLLIALLAGPAHGATPTEESRAVDVVVVLDTSGSMEQLLDSVRARLWDVVGELARMRPTPELRVGLIAFGTHEGTEAGGWIVRHSDLSDDLDAVYADLMALTIGGGEEYVGRALDLALDEMDWSLDWNALRVIFVAGNESADQGAEEHDFRVALAATRDRDIIVNALYAGNREQAIVEKWPEVARKGAGNFSAIDPSLSTIQIATPYDDKLLALNASLNGTYVPYGPNGKDGLANQVAQDGNASSLGVQSCSSRIVTKGSALYSNASWDLVDAAAEDGFVWTSVGTEELPQDLQSLEADELAVYVENRRAEREGVQLKIQQVSREREEYIQTALLREVANDDIGEAMKQAIRDQAGKKGFKCDGC